MGTHPVRANEVLKACGRKSRWCASFNRQGRGNGASKCENVILILWLPDTSPASHSVPSCPSNWKQARVSQRPHGPKPPPCTCTCGNSRTRTDTWQAPHSRSSNKQKSPQCRWAYHSGVMSVHTFFPSTRVPSSTEPFVVHPDGKTPFQ